FGHSLKAPGFYEISGVAYSGAGRIAKVLVSADGGKSWGEAALQAPVLPKAFTRFRMPWRWDGQPVVLQSRAWDEGGNVQPTRAGMPAQGARIYAEKCSACHGDNGRGPTAAGAGPMVSGPISGIDGPKTIGSFYGYSTIVFDFVRRAMPWNMPRTLSNDEVYALTAYLLSINKIIGENDVMNAETLPKVRMPNRDNFIIRFPDRI